MFLALRCRGHRSTTAAKNEIEVRLLTAMIDDIGMQWLLPKMSTVYYELNRARP